MAEPSRSVFTDFAPRSLSRPLKGLTRTATFTASAMVPQFNQNGGRRGDNWFVLCRLGKGTNEIARSGVGMCQTTIVDNCLRILVLRNGDRVVLLFRCDILFQIDRFSKWCAAFLAAPVQQHRDNCAYLQADSVDSCKHTG